MPFPLVPLALTSIAAWLATSQSPKISPPASWPAARGSLPTNPGRFIALRDPLRPPFLQYGNGSRVGLALRGPDGTIVRGEGVILDGVPGPLGGVTVEWVGTLAQLAGDPQGVMPHPTLIVYTGPEGIAWVFSMAAAASDEKPAGAEASGLTQAIIDAARAAMPSSIATVSQPNVVPAQSAEMDEIENKKEISEISDPENFLPFSMAAAASSEPVVDASHQAPNMDEKENDVPLVTEPATLVPLSVDTLGHDNALALSAFGVVQHVLTEDPDVEAVNGCSAASYGEGAERIACVRDVVSGYDAALYIDPDDKRTRLAIWRPGDDPAALRVYRAADVHAALFERALGNQNVLPLPEGCVGMVEPALDVPDMGRMLWSVEPTGPDVAEFLGFLALSHKNGNGNGNGSNKGDTVNLLAKGSVAGQPPTPSRKLSGKRLAEWLLPPVSTVSPPIEAE